MRRKGEDGLGKFGPALFACKAPYQSTILRRTEDLLLNSLVQGLFLSLLVNMEFSDTKTLSIWLYHLPGNNSLELSWKICNTQKCFNRDGQEKNFIVSPI